MNMNEAYNGKTSLIGHMQIVLTELSEVISTAWCLDRKTDEESCVRERGREEGGYPAHHWNIDVSLHWQ